MVNERKKIPLTFNFASIMDVIFLLLIFFMLSSSFLQSDDMAISVELPSAGISERVANKEIVVHIEADGTISVNGRAADYNMLENEIKKIIETAGGGDVIVKADRKSELQLTVISLDAAKAAGADHVMLMTEDRK